MVIISFFSSFFSQRGKGWGNWESMFCWGGRGYHIGDECLKVMLIWGVLSLIVACVVTWVCPGPTEDIEGYMRQEGFSSHGRK